MITFLNDHIKEYVNTHKTWERTGYRRAAYKFVQMEIKAHPDLASSPIAEIEIDAHGKVHWLTRGDVSFSNPIRPIAKPYPRVSA
jgi:hypothetical protein